MWSLSGRLSRLFLATAFLSPTQETLSDRTPNARQPGKTQSVSNLNRKIFKKTFMFVTSCLYNMAQIYSSWDIDERKEVLFLVLSIAFLPFPRSSLAFCDGPLLPSPALAYSLPPALPVCPRCLPLPWAPPSTCSLSLSSLSPLLLFSSLLGRRERATSPSPSPSPPPFPPPGKEKGKGKKKS